jgi:hypothetical protein
VVGIGALACVACCLFPLAVGGLFAGIAGVVFGPVGCITLGIIAAAATITILLRRNRCGPSSAQTEMPVELTPTRQEADR